MELFNGNPFFEVLDQKIENGQFLFKVRRNYGFTAWYELDDTMVRQFRVLNIISENGKLYLIGSRRIRYWHEEWRRPAVLRVNMARKL